MTSGALSHPPAHQAGAPGGTMVALDIDGTLVTHSGELKPAVRDAVTDAVKAGIHVVLATGRSLPWAMPVVRDLNLHFGRLVVSNGAVVAELDPQLPDGVQVLSTRTFDPSAALRLLLDTVPQATFALEDAHGRFDICGAFPVYELAGEVRHVTIEEMLGTEAVRVVMYSPDHSSDDFMALVPSIGLHGVAYSVGWTAWLDIAPEGVNKSLGLSEVATVLGVDRAHTVAAGDGRNDLEMLQWAGFAVAMGNACQEAKDSAHLTVGDVTEEGVVPMLRALIDAEGDVVAAATSLGASLTRRGCDPTDGERSC